MDGLEQFNFVRSKKLCDNCLSPFHFSTGFKCRKECKVPGCDMRCNHLTMLIRTENSEQNPSKKLPCEDEEGHFSVSYDYTRAGCSRKGLPIVPVKVKGHGKKTYALLDNGSNATFCTNNLLKQLGAGGRNVISLSQQLMMWKKSEKVSLPPWKSLVLTRMFLSDCRWLFYESASCL